MGFDSNYQWQPIATGPDCERVMVCGWQKADGGTRGYWWYHEDVICAEVACEHPSATHWAPLVIPPFPKEPTHD